MIIDHNDKNFTVMNKETGVIRHIAWATDAQFQYLQTLRAKAGRAPLKGKPTVYAAKKQIDTLLAKLNKD